MEELELSYITGGNMKLLQLLQKIVWHFLKKVKQKLLHHLMIPLLGTQELYKNFKNYK